MGNRQLRISISVHVLIKHLVCVLLNVLGEKRSIFFKVIRDNLCLRALDSCYHPGQLETHLLVPSSVMVTNVRGSLFCCDE